MLNPDKTLSSINGTYKNCLVNCYHNLPRRFVPIKSCRYLTRRGESWEVRSEETVTVDFK